LGLQHQAGLEAGANPRSNTYLARLMPKQFGLAARRELVEAKSAGGLNTPAGGLGWLCFGFAGLIQNQGHRRSFGLVSILVSVQSAGWRWTSA
jgi:hypothetical protein